MSNVTPIPAMSRAKGPATRADMENGDNAILYAIAEVLKDERALTEARLRELDGAHLLLGSARRIAAANVEAITKAIAPTTQRKAVVVEGDVPQWAAGVFS